MEDKKLVVAGQIVNIDQSKIKLPSGLHLVSGVVISLTIDYFDEERQVVGINVSFADAQGHVKLVPFNLPIRMAILPVVEVNAEMITQADDLKDLFRQLLVRMLEKAIGSISISDHELSSKGGKYPGIEMLIEVNGQFYKAVVFKKRLKRFFY